MKTHYVGERFEAICKISINEYAHWIGFEITQNDQNMLYTYCIDGKSIRQDGVWEDLFTLEDCDPGHKRIDSSYVRLTGVFTEEMHRAVVICAFKYLYAQNSSSLQLDVYKGEIMIMRLWLLVCPGLITLHVHVLIWMESSDVLYC